MSTEFLTKRKVIIATAAILALGGGVWGVVAMTGGKKSSLPKELQNAIKADANDPGKLMATAWAAAEKGNLTEAQRHELFHSVHTAMDEQMNKRIETYFAAAPADRNAILDRDIDEMQTRMKDWQKNHPPGSQDPNHRGFGGNRPGGPGQPNAAGTGTTGANANPGGPPGGPPGGGFGDRHGPPTREQRKDHFESRNPDEHARRMAYFNALHARAQQRGIQLPMGPRGGGGR